MLNQLRRPATQTGSLHRCPSTGEHTARALPNTIAAAQRCALGVDLLELQPPPATALQGLLQQSYASNKTLWHQLTTAGQAQVQLFRDMQHQKTIAQVSRWQGCNSRHCPTTAVTLAMGFLAAA